MSSDLDIHPASAEELVAAHRNVHDIWSKGLTLDDHIRYRLDSPSHRRATWFVGCLDGRVVVSLGCYPLQFRIEGEESPGIAIGSVYTLAEVRGRGFAPRLIAWVEQYNQQRGAALSVLYSDIDPDYYARLGYARCPSLTAAETLLPASESNPSGGLRLVAISAEEHLSKLMRTYGDFHGAWPLSVARDAHYWAAILKKFPDDTFHALQDERGVWLGYARIGRRADAWRITDFALANHSQALAEHFYAAVLQWAQRAKAGRVSGWLPDSPAAKKFFQLVPRRTEITMIKPLAWPGNPSPEMIERSSYFCEIDHV